MITIHTDGGCWPNPGGVGGWGAIIQIDGREFELSGAEDSTTNNRMEILAAIEGLKRLELMRRYIERVVVISDSQYLVRGANEWMQRWVMVGWKRKQKHVGMVDVKNDDLWRELYRLKKLQAHCTFRWVRGHAGDEMNERCDVLASDAAHALRPDCGRARETFASDASTRGVISV